MPKIKSEHRASWARRNATVVLEELLPALDKEFSKYDTDAQIAFYSHLVAGVLHQVVLESLSVSVKDINTKKKEVIMAQVSENFRSLVKVTEASIGAAFEQGVSKATKSNPFFVCKISHIKGSANDEKAPC